MWIEELDICGFRRLRGQYRLAKGITLVVGENEAGKTTLQDAIIRALFGFSRAERRRSAGVSLKDRCAPWNGGEFGLTALVHEARGRSYRIEWEFGAHRVTLRDADTGADLSERVRRKRDDVALGEFLLGLGLEEFRDVCCLEQAEIAAVRRTENLILALQTSVESAAGEVGIDEAVALLNDALRDFGVHVLHLTPVPNGRLAGVERELGEARAGLASCEAARVEIGRLANELEGCARRLAALRADANVLDQRVLGAEADELRRQVETARRLRARVHAPAEAGPEPAGGAIEAARSALHRQRVLDEQIAELEGAVARAGPEVARLTARERDLEAASAQAVEARVDIMQESRVRELAARRQQAAAETLRIEIPPAPARDPALMQYRTERARLLDLQQKGQQEGRDRRAVLVAAVVAAASIGLGVAAHPAFLSGLIVALALFALAARGGGLAHQRALAAALAAFGVTSLDVLETRAREEDRRTAAAEALAQERAGQAARAGAAQRAIEDELERLLDDAAAPPRPSLPDRVGAYLTGCQRQAEQARRLAEVESVRSRIAPLRASLEDLGRRRTERDRAQADLAGQLRDLGIEEADPARAAAVLEQVARRLAERAAKAAEASEAASALGALLGSDTIEHLQQLAANAEQAWADHVDRFGRLAEDAGDRQDLAAERARVARDLRSTELKAEELRTKIQDREDGLADPAELKERIAELEVRMDRAHVVTEAIQIARATLHEAATETHRRFAPHLRTALERHLPTITSGRYRRAVVDEDLMIRVEAPETGRLVSVEELSRGTQEQIYLVERLEIARLLDPTTGEAPLLLDGPFARFDENRLRLALQILGEVARERQVVLFSEDRKLIAGVREVCADCEVIELPPPAVVSVV